MAFRTWGRLLLTALGVSVLTGAGQLGIAYGLGIMRLDGAFTDGAVNRWPAQLAWVGWFAAVAAVAGAVGAERFARPDGTPDGTNEQLSVAGAAALGALVVAPLCMQPARATELGGTVDPAWAVGICAILGAVLGAGAAIVVLLKPPFGWNIALTAAVVWLFALLSVAPTVSSTGPLVTVRLGVLEPSWLDADTAERLAMLLLPLVALLAGAAVGGLARRRGHLPLVGGAAGAVGPGLLAFAYLTAGPGSAADRYQLTPYYGALIAVAAGVLGSAATTVLRRPVAEPEATVLQPTDILQPLPPMPAAPGNLGTAAGPAAGPDGADPAADGVVETPNRCEAGREGSPTGAMAAAPAHWDWPSPAAVTPAPLRSRAVRTALDRSTSNDRLTSTVPISSPEPTWSTEPTGNVEFPAPTPPTGPTGNAAPTENAGNAEPTAPDADQPGATAASPTPAAPEPDASPSADHDAGMDESDVGPDADDLEQSAPVPGLLPAGRRTSAIDVLAAGRPAPQPPVEPEKAPAPTSTSAPTPTSASVPVSASAPPSTPTPTPAAASAPAPASAPTSAPAPAPGSGSGSGSDVSEPMPSPQSDVGTTALPDSASSAVAEERPAGPKAKPNPPLVVAPAAPPTVPTGDGPPTGERSVRAGGRMPPAPTARPAVGRRSRRQPPAVPEQSPAGVNSAGADSAELGPARPGTAPVKPAEVDTTGPVRAQGDRPGTSAPGGTPVSPQAAEAVAGAAGPNLTDTGPDGRSRPGSQGRDSASATPDLATGKGRSTSRYFFSDDEPVADDLPPTVEAPASPRPRSPIFEDATDRRSGFLPAWPVGPAPSQPVVSPPSQPVIPAPSQPVVPPDSTGPDNTQPDSARSDSARSDSAGPDNTRPDSAGLGSSGPDSVATTDSSATSTIGVPERTDAPTDEARGGPTPRPRRHALPDLSRGPWDAFANARRANPVGPQTDGRHGDSGEGVTTGPAAEVEPGGGKSKLRRGLFRRNRAKDSGPGDAHRTDHESEPLAAQDEEYVDWVAGLASDGDRKGVRPPRTGRHHRD